MLFNGVQRLLERLWYGNSPFSVFLSPLSLLYRLALVLRKKIIPRPGLFPLPIVVVGNLTMGGTGKTPMVIHLARILHENGFQPGIISRGYGASDNRVPRLVSGSDTAAACGDESVVLAMESDCPVVICRDRYQAALYLKENTKVNVVISDDGMQHHHLPRHIEILMIDGLRGFGNGRLLPAGPLREPLSKIESVDFMVVKGAHWENCYRMDLQLTGFVELKSGEKLKPEAFAGREVHACAAIGNPETFFRTLTESGAKCRRHVFPDHHRFKPEDLVFRTSLPVLMTQKDAIKCQGFPGELWFTRTEAKLEQGFNTAFIQFLRSFTPGGLVCG